MKGGHAFWRGDHLGFSIVPPFSKYAVMPVARKKITVAQLLKMAKAASQGRASIFCAANAKKREYLRSSGNPVR